MTGTAAMTIDLSAFLSFIVLSAGIVAALLAAAFARRDAMVRDIAVASLAAALLSLAVAADRIPVRVTDLFVLDGVAVLASGVILFTALCIAVLALPYFRMHGLPGREFQVLLLLATLGGMVIASSSHFASLFLGIELVGIPLAVLAAYHRSRPTSTEAGFKYLILAGVSSAVLLFGIALIYAGTGSLSFGPALAPLGLPLDRAPLVFLGAAFLIAGLGFKLAVVPFHFWAPDVYEGAPAPVTIFAATVSKAAIIAVLLRLFPPAVIGRSSYLFLLLAAISLASMILGNVLAVRQRNVKRMLAYSSIAHNGYLLVAFLSAGPRAAAAVVFYLVSYAVTNLAAFGVVSLLSAPGGDADDLNDYAGLSWRRPWPAGILTIALLSLLGIPLTAGFIAKFLVAAAGIASLHYVLVLALVLNTVVSAYYYLRVVMLMFINPSDVRAGSIRHEPRRVPLGGVLALSVPALLLLWLGTAPQFLLRLIGRLLP